MLLPQLDFVINSNSVKLYPGPLPKMSGEIFFSKTALLRLTRSFKPRYCILFRPEVIQDKWLILGEIVFSET